VARDAHDREDLLRDARGLSPRVQLEMELSAGATQLFAGFRGESLSLYFGQDLVFHFNDRGELRRAFVAEELLKAERGGLVAMRRERTAAEVSLVTRPLEDAEQQSLLDDLQRGLRELADTLAAERYRVVGDVPANSNAVARLKAWLDAHRGPIALAASPHVG
jgi:hypothetical protein